MEQKEYSTFQKALSKYFLRPVFKPAFKAFERQRQKGLVENLTLIAGGAIMAYLVGGVVGPIIIDVVAGSLRSND